MSRENGNLFAFGLADAWRLAGRLRRLPRDSAREFVGWLVETYGGEDNRDMMRTAVETLYAKYLVETAPWRAKACDPHCTCPDCMVDHISREERP